MRFKPVPPAPEALETIAAVREAVPLVPKPEADCCARLLERRDLQSRDVARTWLTFLRALGLVAAHDRGFAREGDVPDREVLADRFRERVYGAREVLEVLAAADEPLSPAEVFERVEGVVPQWERDREPTWRERWTDRVGRLCAWAVLLGLAERTAADRYTS